MSAFAGTAHVRIEPDFRQFNTQVAAHLRKPLSEKVDVKVDTTALKESTKHVVTHANALEGVRKGYEGVHHAVLGTVAGLVGAGGVIAAFEETVKAGADVEASQVKVERAVRNAGISWSAHGDEIEKWIERTAAAKGFMEGDLSQAFANMIRTTGNVKQAQVLLNDAMDVSRTKGVDLAGAQSLLARVYNGNYMGLKRLGIAITPVTTAHDALATATSTATEAQKKQILSLEAVKNRTAAQQAELDKLKTTTTKATDEQKAQAKATDQQATRTEALRIIQQKFGGQADAYAKTTSGHYASLKVQLEETEATIGKTLLPDLSKLAQKGQEAAKGLQEHWPEIKKDITDVVKPMEDVGGAVVNFAKHNPDLAKAAASFVGISWAVKRMTGVSVGKEALSLIKLVAGGGVAAKGGGSGVLGQLVLTRGDTPLKPMFVYVVNGGGSGGGPGKLPSEAPKTGEGAGGASALSRLRSLVRGGAAGEGGLNDVLSGAAIRSPIGFGGALTLGIGAFASGAQAPTNQPIAKLKALAHGADPTNIMHVVGLPSVTDLLHWGSRTPMQQSIQRQITGRTDSTGWGGITQIGVPGVRPVVRQTASIRQQTADYSRMNNELSKLERHQQGIKATAFDLDYLAKQARKLGDVKYAFADKLGAEMLRARGASSKGITNVLKEVAKLPPGARKQASDAMILMARGMESSREVPQGTAAKITDKILDSVYSLHADQKRGSKVTGAKMSADLIDALTFIGQKGVPINAKTKDDILGQFEELRRKGGDKFTNPKTGIKAEAIKAFQDLQAGVVPTGDATATLLYQAFQKMGVNAQELASALGIKVPRLKLTAPQRAVIKAGANVASGVTGAINRLGFGQAEGGLWQIGRPGAAGHDSIPMSVGGTDLVVGDGEQIAVLNRHHQADLNRMLARQGGLTGYFNRNKRPHYMATGGLATATYFGGPSDPATGHVGYRGDDLNLHPDSYAELGMGTRLGGLPYMTPLNLTYHGKTARAFKRDIGAGAPGAAIDLWYMLANALGFTGKDSVQINGPAGVNIQISGGGGVGGGGGPAPQLGKYTLDAPPGILKSLGQGLMDKGRDQWNQWLAAHAPAPTTGSGAAGAPVFPVTPGPTPPAVQRALQAAVALAARHEPYQYGGFGWDSPGLDCSGFVSTVMNAAGLWNGYYTAASPINAITDPGPGKWITIGTWGSSGQNAHTMMEVDGRYFESGGRGGGPHEDAGWSMNFDQYRHPHGYAKGGFLRGRIGEPGYQVTQEEAQRIFREHKKTGRHGPIKAATGLVTGGAGLARGLTPARGGLTGTGSALKGAGVTTLKDAKWWRNLAPILGEIKSKSKRGQPDLTRFLKRIKQLGLGGLQDTITQGANAVTRDAAYSDTAAGLIDTDALGRTLVNDLSWQKPELYPAGWDPAKDALPPNVENIQKGVIDNFLQQYKVLGKTQLGWLTRELADQATLRGNLISLAKKIREDWLQRTRVLDAARKKAQRLRDHIRHLTTQINAKLKQLHPPKGHKPPSKAQAKQLNDDIKRLRGDLAGDQRELDALVHPDTGVIPATEAQLQTLTDALGTGGMHGGQDLPKLYQSYGPSSDGVMGQLYALEGPVTSPFRRLGANGARTLMAEGPTVWFGDIGNVLSQIAGYDKQWFQQPSLPSSSDAGVIPEDLFAKQLQQWAGERSGLSALEGMTISRYGGSFDKGGTVPGPVGAPILITAHGGEEVLSLEDRAQGSHTFEIHGDPRTVALLEQMIEKVNVKSNRGQARSADRRMRLPGNAVR